MSLPLAEAWRGLVLVEYPVYMYSADSKMVHAPDMGELVACQMP